MPVEVLTFMCPSLVENVNNVVKPEGELACCAVRSLSGPSQRLQEVDQVLHLLLREANLEALVIKIDQLL